MYVENSCAGALLVPRAQLALAAGLLLSAGCADSLVQTDTPDAFPVDVTRIDHALVASTTVVEGPAYGTWTWDMYMEFDGFGELMKDDGRLGTAIVLLTGDNVGCADLTDGAPPRDSEGLVLAYHWWTTAPDDPDWVGEYAVDPEVVEGEALRLARVGAWDGFGAWLFDPSDGTLGLDSWAETVSGDAALSYMDASFTAETCGGGS